jgi:hypothetical protein
MIKCYLLLISIFFLGTNDTFAFNKEECVRYLENDPHTHKLKSPFIEKDLIPFSITTIPLYLSTQTSNATILATQSSDVTSQLSSSYGPCRTFDFREREKLEFIAYNFDRLRIESARGEGEHIQALSLLLKCKTAPDVNLGKFLQRNFKAVYFLNYPVTSTPSEAYTRMSDLFSKDSFLAKSCKKSL